MYIQIKRSPPASQIVTALLSFCLLLAHFAWADSPSTHPAGTIDPKCLIAASLGKREVILASGQCGLKYFPDECLAFLQTTPSVRVLAAAGVSTSLLEGPDMRSLVLRGQVLKPGEAGSFDSGYAGICGVARDPNHRQLLAFYHAEDHEGMPPIPGGIPGFYCSVGLAVSEDDGASFRKIGPVVTSAIAKDVKGRSDQGCGDLCVVADGDHRYLYMYYSDHSRPENRGVQICVARCAIEDAARSDRWKKFYDGSFDEPGLGGKDTPVVSAQAMQADAIFPQVTFIPELRRYVMVFNITVYREFGQDLKPEKSGIYIASSRDGICWSAPTQLLPIRSIAAIGKEVGWHPSLLLEKVEDNHVKGWLYYSYSESWGHKAPQKPHYLVGQPITFSILER